MYVELQSPIIRQKSDDLHRIPMFHMQLMKSDDFDVLLPKWYKQDFNVYFMLLFE